MRRVPLNEVSWPPLSRPQRTFLGGEIMKFRTSLATTVCLLALAPLSAFAQLEEITVTARKTEETLQTAPLSITAFSGEQIEQHSIASLQDLQLFTPGMSFFSFGNRSY